MEGKNHEMIGVQKVSGDSAVKITVIGEEGKSSVYLTKDQIEEINKENKRNEIFGEELEEYKEEKTAKEVEKIQLAGMLLKIKEHKEKGEYYYNEGRYNFGEYQYKHGEFKEIPSIKELLKLGYFITFRNGEEILGVTKNIVKYKYVKISWGVEKETDMKEIAQKQRAYEYMKKEEQRMKEQLQEDEEKEDEEGVEESKKGKVESFMGKLKEKVGGK